MTEQLRTEAQLRQLQADFSRAARISTLGELATSIAHEVSQPLSAIVTNAETSLRWLSRADPNVEKVAHLTARIEESARRATSIVQRIRGTSAMHSPECVPLDLNEVIDEALLFVRHDLESRSIGLTMELGPELPPIVGDRVQLQQVLVNLMLNSIQAIVHANLSSGRISLSTKRTDHKAVHLEVSDNGPGIPEESIDRIFEGFFTTKEDGIGIGLAICQSIVMAHNGNIAVFNLPDGGARFIICLPEFQGKSAA
jgi:C4-dicarboxylate-specific signal transduction histidine kinase